MNGNLPTRQEINELVSFLPKLYADEFIPIKKWEDYPVYDELVKEFFEIASRKVWTDFDYDIDQSAQMLSDKNLLKSANISQIKSMLTYCVRGERFSDGHWSAMIENYNIGALLHRLSELNR